MKLQYNEKYPDEGPTWQLEVEDETVEEDEVSALEDIIREQVSY